MKIWNSFGSEHSANLVIIGKFKTVQEAVKAELALAELAKLAATQLLSDPEADDSHMPKPILDAVSRLGTTDLSTSDVYGLGYDHDWDVEDDKLVVTTEESSVQGILKIMLRHGAKIEMYSAHDYPGKYGR